MSSLDNRFLILLVCLTFFAESATSQDSSRPQAPPAAKTQPAKKPAGRGRRESPEAAQKREAGLKAIMERLKIGPGATVADIGAGKGRDTWVFAEVVGAKGRVLAEEITDGLVDGLKKEVKNRGLQQVHPVLGKTDGPCLPEGVVDLAYMHYVYHHFAQPAEMLNGLWRSLKPGGYLVIADRHLGTLQDWVPRTDRGAKHFWIAETTVVRDAREAGFAFFDCLEDCWEADDQFILVFQRPENESNAGSDPDLPMPLNFEMVTRELLPKAGPLHDPVFIALGESRKLIAPIMAKSTGEGLDIVLEEWATAKDERPALPNGVALPSTLTQQGDPQLGERAVGAAFFLDTYHLLFHHQVLLEKLHERISADGLVVVLDRKSDDQLSHRLASHRRKISPDLVKREMAAAGFELLSEQPAPAADRFLLVFGKSTSPR